MTWSMSFHNINIQSLCPAMLINGIPWINHVWSKVPVAVWFARNRLIKRLISISLLHPLTLWLDFEDLLLLSVFQAEYLETSCYLLR